MGSLAFAPEKEAVGGVGRRLGHIEHRAINASYIVVFFAAIHDEDNFILHFGSLLNLPKAALAIVY